MSPVVEKVVFVFLSLRYGADLGRSRLVDFYTCDKQVLWESAHSFTRQVAQFTRSLSSGKVLAFQPRGFVFEPVRMRLFFYKYSEAEGSHFFGTMRLSPFSGFVSLPKIF